MTGQVPRSRTPSADISDSLLQAALDLLEEVGTSGLTVRGVALTARVAPMGVYSRFGSKDGLLEALFTAGFTGLNDEILRATGPTAIYRLLDGCQRYREFALAQPQLYRLMFEQMMALDLSDEALLVAKGSFDCLVTRVADAVVAGELGPGEFAQGDFVEQAQLIWSAMHGAVSLEIANVHFAQDRSASYGAMLVNLFVGMGASRDSLV
ncbi:MAG: TetR/AcrR family transcriptional regulator [Actinomycetota bacterium]|nr:TetR/AcrR family transcriptional regulator [Actinomycetota bacterium]MDP2288369.1 TetR/AcrR family transcriptional regulator [Actinomycetota bacterium]